METKAMTPVKKDTPPIVRYTAGKVLGVVASDMSYTNMKSTITMILGKFLTRLESNKLPAEMQVAETRRQTDRERVSISVDTGIGSVDVHKGWVVKRITGAVKTILDRRRT
jgi:hypothetical protein